MKTCKLGLIGAGRIGQLHAENITHFMPEGELLAISDPYLDQNWVKTLGAVQTFSSYHDLLAIGEIDKVLICSPSSLHIEHIIAVAKAGKDIFCEKPISHDITDIHNALKVVEKSGIKFQVGFNRRFDANFAKIRKYIAEGAVGDIQLLRITSRDPALPPYDYLKTSGGLFLDQTIHDFDMARFLTNSEIVQVYASGAALIDPKLADIGDIDTAIVQLKFANGALGVIDNSRQAVYGYDQRVEVFGNKGSCSTENKTPTNTVKATADGIISDKPLYFFLERYQQSYVDEIKEFIGCVGNKQLPSVDGEAGLMAVLVAKAAQKSLDRNQPVDVQMENE